MNKLYSKLLVSATSGLFGKILLISFCLSAGYIGSKFPIMADSAIIKTIVYVLCGILAMFSLVICLALPIILEWISWLKESKKDGLKLENENLRLKKEILELEKQKSRK